MSERSPVFATTADLTAWLEGHGVDTNAYRDGQSKSVATLLSELQSGESVLVLENAKVLRRLRVVTLLVTCGDLTLVEERQVLADGREWTRGFQGDSLAEKMLRGERVMDAAARALREELGLADSDFTLGKERRTDIEERSSWVYPGIRSRFVLHRIVAEVLPSGFRAEGYVEHQDEKDTFFAWKARG